MDISVTAFRAHCLELIRQMEAGGEPITRTWDQLRGSGSLLAFPEESLLQADDFEALR